jgi:hypothetical protein
MNETPMSQMFDAQQTMIKQSNEAFKRGLAVQREAVEAFRDALDVQEETQRRNVEATQRMVDAYFEALSDAGADGMGVAAAQEGVDEQFAMLLELHAQSWDAVDRLVEENAAAYDDLVEQFASMADDSAGAAFDTSRGARARTEIVVESVDDASQR